MNLSKDLLKKFTTNEIISKRTLNIATSILLTVGAWGVFGNVVRAESTNDIPEDLVKIVTKIETAANERDLESLMSYYDDDFSNEDGLTTSSVKMVLEKLWSMYPQLKYETTINSWSKKGDELIVETTTQITGSQNDRGSVVNLESNVKSRQYFQDSKLVRQEILAEKTQVSSGDRPPQLQVNLPETVKIGEKYNFDTIVTEPLEGSILLGAALEERTGSNLYLRPSRLELEPLSAGGIFKVVTAPRLSDNHWLSAIVVRGDGITMVTQRVRIEK